MRPVRPMFGLVRDVLQMSDEALHSRFHLIDEEIIKYPPGHHRIQQLRYAQAQLLMARELKRIMENAKDCPW